MFVPSTVSIDGCFNSDSIHGLIESWSLFPVYLGCEERNSSEISNLWSEFGCQEHSKICCARVDDLLILGMVMPPLIIPIPSMNGIITYIYIEFTFKVYTL